MKVRRIKEKHRLVCQEIVENFADIAVNIAEHKDHVPYFTWNELRTSFLKGQPIFELTDYLDDVHEEPTKITNEEEMKEEEEEEEGAFRTGKCQRTLRLESEHRRNLIDTDFENYQHLSPPWDKFVPEVRAEDVEDVPKLGRVVLGYVVHRLLEILYPYPSEMMDCPVPRVRVAAVVLGVTNSTMHEQLRELLKNSEIRLLRMEDAINHCLECYKREMSDVRYIDLNIVAATAKDTQEEREEVGSERGELKNRRPRKIEATTRMTPQQSAVDEKQTQTPRQIPYDDMDPILSDTAYIGKEICSG